MHHGAGAIAVEQHRDHDRLLARRADGEAEPHREHQRGERGADRGRAKHGELFQNRDQADGAVAARAAAPATRGLDAPPELSPAGRGSVVSSNSAKRMRQRSTSRAKAGVGGQPPLGFDLGLAFEQAEHVFGRHAFVAFASGPSSHALLQ